ncbi:Dendrite extension defective protein 1 [Caenorhabditis elegans]|uniref:Isoform a of Dendrite extension defective protein 1 n=1 Tax=Caenorhabditis elegans TaxID=6239 RepID=P41950-2|nr:Dendrite extension defective protein 1 [Caenorhabditis elegans]CCD68378.1 Dendrite extension defective protein 1 [Caenorhabditis elegans]|eukprot:NP_498181.3 Dendrite extension defective protein 1 [Caenorhabditis elegans]
MRNRHALLGALPPIFLLLLPLISCMKFDPERIAARLRIDEKWDQLDAFQSIKSRRGRQIQPKEISIQVTAPLFSSRLFDYGTTAGDEELPQALDVGKKLDLVHPISFFGSDYKTIYILSNGAVGFEASSRSYKSGILPSSTRFLAPFWNRNDLRNGGKVYYREVTKGRVLERGQSEIRYQYDKNVKVKSALIITWDKMQPLNTAALPEENTNTFQAAIFITANGTFANFIYSNIGWTQGAEAGFNAGDATNHFKLPTSGTPNIMYLEEYGNTGIPGEWMFELSELRVISCKSGIKGDTCDQECSNGEWGPDCAYCCHCSEGTCHPISGDCQRGCATCWDGVACQTRQEKCATKTQCASNALSFNDYDRCGEPIQRCQCLNGYKGDGYNNCEDVDECKTNSTICHKNAICTNTPGRYFCMCKEGFSGDGQNDCSQSFLFQYDTHHQLPRKKNSKMEWNLKKPLKIFGETTEKLTVTSTGLIAINEVNRDNGRLEDMQLVGIAPFFGPIDLSRNGAVSVEEVDDVEVLRRVTRTIGENYNDPTFVAKSALVVTFSNVTDGRQTKGNTFQALLIDGSNSKNEKMTFVELMYRDLPWASGAEAGILSSDASSSILLPASGTEAISQLSKNSNIKQPGTWLYRIDKAQLMPCAQPIQVPPYCDRLLSTAPRLPSKLLEEKKEGLTLPSPGAFLVDQPSETIVPTLVRGGGTVTRGRNVLTVTTSPIGNQQRQQTTKAVTRPRPNFSSTPHRPIVSLSDEDFELGPDAFEVTFPPFVTVQPELFRPNQRNGVQKSTQRPLPDFSIRTPLKEEATTSVPREKTSSAAPAHSPIEEMSENEESPFEAGSFDGEAVKFNEELEAIDKALQTTKKQRPELSVTPQPEDLSGDARVIETTEEDEEEAEISTETTTEMSSTTTTTKAHTTTTTMMIPTEAPPSIFVFTTTQKPRAQSTTQKRIIVQQPSIVVNSQPPKQRNDNQPTVNVGHAEEQSPRLAILLPVMIILAWLVILVCIGAVVCCKRRNSRESSQLRAMYGAAYGVRPTAYESKRKESTYEDHLERAARLSGQPALSGQQKTTSESTLIECVRL